MRCSTTGKHFDFAQVLLITLSMTAAYSRGPVSHYSVTVNQYQDPETKAAKWSLAIVDIEYIS